MHARYLEIDLAKHISFQAQLSSATYQWHRSYYTLSSTANDYPEEPRQGASGRPLVASTGSSRCTFDATTWRWAYQRRSAENGAKLMAHGTSARACMAICARQCWRGHACQMQSAQAHCLRLEEALGPSCNSGRQLSSTSIVYRASGALFMHSLTWPCSRCPWACQCTGVSYS